jgi:Na+/H+ antiporter NhaD/arsenite permease-like protein
VRKATGNKREGIGPLLLWVATLGCAFTLATGGWVDLSSVLARYPWDVLILAAVFDLFSRFIVATGTVSIVAVALGTWSKAQPIRVMVAFSAIFFAMSSLVNNLAATQILAPVFLLLLSAMTLDRRFVRLSLSLILAVINLGGFASPVGDFPALYLLASGIISFPRYLALAFPLACITMVVLVMLYLMRFSFLMTAKGGDSQNPPELAVLFLRNTYKYHKIHWRDLIKVAVSFVGICAAFCLLPPSQFPPAMVGLAGSACLGVLMGPRNVLDHLRAFDLRPLTFLAGCLLASTLLASTGVLGWVASWLEGVPHPVARLLAMMAVTSVMAAICGAGPATAAMGPVLQTLITSGGALQPHADVVTVAFAAAICSGSSLFLWSATSGPLLSHSVESRNLHDGAGRLVTWGVGSHLVPGVGNFVLQFLVASLWAVTAISVSW